MDIDLWHWEGIIKRNGREPGLGIYSSLVLVELDFGSLMCSELSQVILLMYASLYVMAMPPQTPIRISLSLKWDSSQSVC